MMKIEIWSDYVCPFCYIGKTQLEHALDTFSHKDDVEIVFKSFELEPSTPPYSENSKSVYEATAANMVVPLSKPNRQWTVWNNKRNL